MPNIKSSIRIVANDSLTKDILDFTKVSSFLLVVLLLLIFVFTDFVLLIF